MSENTGVNGAALIDWLPLRIALNPLDPGFTIVGKSDRSFSGKTARSTGYYQSDYFRLMGIPILRGRGVTEQDTETSPAVVVINEAMARQFWPNEDPVGREITFDSSPKNGRDKSSASRET